MSNGSVLVVGSLNMDLVAQVQDMPRIGETIIGHSFDRMMGGKGANQAVAAARLGARVAMIGCFGSDAFAGDMRSILAKERIETDGIRTVENVSTGTAMIMVDRHGDNSIIVAPGANRYLGPDDIERHTELFESSDVVVLQLEIPLETVLHSVAAARRFGKTVVFNPAPMQGLSEELLRDIDYLILNEVEAEELTGAPASEFDTLAKRLAALPCKHVVLTLGGDGAAYISGSEVVRYPAMKVHAVDTTGAGDSFIGAFASRLARGDDARDAVKYAIKVAAITVTKLGAQAALPTEEETKQFDLLWGAESR
ncbi:ribokinase [Paenibacillus ginsengarvi]|uniref:Ribokinase n=1 Tax=Paenibacillus ginsengarvi TaxID=400777 RepID=A0A3B0BNQ8_9BACL|nr:ribokinase [Paenibacillus ginsengarvi]RKN74154.1 ribokinase [Paenibacillus ginsengarvi]